MVRRPACRLRHHAGKAQGRQVQFVNEGFNDAHGIVGRHIVVQTRG